MCLAAFFNVVSSSLASNVMSQSPSDEVVPVYPDLLFCRNLPCLISLLAVSRFTGTRLLTNPLKGADRFAFFLRIATPSFTFLCTCMALQRVDVAIYTVLFQMNPFLTSVGARIFLKTPICRQDLLAMVLCFTAICVIVSFKVGVDDASHGMGASGAAIMGLPLAFTAANSVSISNVTSKRLAYIPWNFLLFYVSLFATCIWIVYSFCHWMATGTFSIASLSSAQII